MHYFNREIGLETYGLWKLYLEEKLNLEMPYYNQLYETESRKYDYLINIDEHVNDTGTLVATGDVKQNTSNNKQANGTANRTITDSGRDVITHDINEHTKGNLNQSGNTTVTDESNTKTSGTTIGSDFPQATFNKNTDYATDSSQTESNNTSGSSSNSNSTNVATNDDTKEGTDVDTTDYGKNVADNLTTLDTAMETGNVNTNDTKNQDTVNNQYSYGTRGSKTQLLMEYRSAILNIDKMVVQMLQELFMGVY